MMGNLHDMIKESVEVFMDDFSVFGNSFDTCLNNLDKMLQSCKDAHLVLNWEKCHFMVKEEIVLGYKVSSAGLEVDKAKIDVISKLPPLLISKNSKTKGTENVCSPKSSYPESENDEYTHDNDFDDNFPRENTYGNQIPKDETLVRRLYKLLVGTLALRYGKLRSMLKIALLQLCISLCPGKYHSP
ncbi:hypothetical protein Tco_1561553 [Tanacetum coccineum]